MFLHDLYVTNVLSDLLLWHVYCVRQILHLIVNRLTLAIYNINYNKSINIHNIYLVGNPNVGKSLLFQQLSGSFVEVSNYAGTTVDTFQSKFVLQDVEYNLIDTPGIYDLNYNNDESRITREMLETITQDNSQGNLIINVANVLTLERDLYLTLQLQELNIPVILILNQIDLLDDQCLTVDHKLLSKILNITVIPVSAKTNTGLNILEEIIANLPEYKYLADLPEYKLSTRERRNSVEDIINQVQNCPQVNNQVQVFLDKILLHPLWGSIIAIGFSIFLLFQFLGVWIAGDLVGLLEDNLFNAYINPFIQSTIQLILPIAKGDLLNSQDIWIDWKTGLLTSLGTILAGDYGILTLTITYLIGVLMPLVWFFYLTWAILEDSGYLPRLAVLSDILMRNIGLNGRGVIPLILGLGCVTMAMVTTRLLTNRREQLIMMILLSLAIPCSAQLGIIQGLLARLGGFTGWGIWAVIILAVMYISGYLACRLLPGEQTPLIIDLPTYKIPQFTNIIKKANQKTYFFLKESGPAFFWASLILGIFQVTGVLNVIIDLMRPLVSGLLHLPEDVTISFLLGMIRRDFGAFGLLDLDLSLIQVITACVSLTLFVPCIATLAVMIKERDLKTATIIWLLSWVLGFGMGAILTRILEIIPMMQ